jgi:HSP20 family protein
MSKLVRWNPFRDMVAMSEAVDRLFDENGFPVRNGGYRLASPALDVVENENNFVVKAEMPGFAPEQVDISIEGTTLTLRGNVKDEAEKDEGQYHIRERRQNSFVRTLSLPVTVNTEKATAEFENGILTLTLPKKEEVLPKRIAITPKSKK